MASRMTDVSTPHAAGEPMPESPSTMPRVRVIVTPVEDADLGTALATIERQVYEGPRDLIVVGGEGAELPEGAVSASSLEEAIAGAEPVVDYLWIVHADARPRPDALAALVSEVDRNEASLGGSKILVAGTRDELESIGSATDVFGDAYSGLDVGEIDLQQYDVVREVASVSSVSMLVRRDLAQGLRGLDPLMEPVAAGLDFSQRIRLAGGRVITVPSSEVYHQARCGERGRGWREEAGRLRAMLKAYRPITLVWVIPFNILVSLVDSLANLVVLRWRPSGRHLIAWLWNLWHLPSTISARRRFHPVRAFGDEELFRFQARGSVRLREIGSEITDRILSAFDDDQALAKSSRRVWSSPGIWGALIAMIVIFFGVRTIFFTGVPNTGFSFPFESPTVAADRFFAGWNDAGLGSPDAVHPVVGLSALAGLIAFGAEGVARTLLTVLFGFVGVVGMGRLVGRLGFRGPSRYLSGLVLMAGPGTAALAGAGSWVALGGAALLPWAVRAVFLHPTDRGKSRLTHTGWAIVLSMLLTAFSPLLGLVPLVVALVWALFGGSRSSISLGLVALVGGLVAVGFVHDDLGWATDATRRIGLVVPIWWTVVIALIAISLVLVDTRARRLGGVGGVLALGALALARLGVGGPGVEEASLILASLGAALVVAAGLDKLSLDPRRMVAAAGALVVLVVSSGALLGGRLGLPADDLNDRLSFASTLAGDSGPGRILLVSGDRGMIPGESNTGPGFWYRTVGGDEVTIDELWLPAARMGDEALADELETIASGSELRPGSVLSQFAIDWVVVEGPEIALDSVLGSQLDLIPTPLVEGSRVYENVQAAPLAVGEGDVVWHRDGAGYAGLAYPGRVQLAVNHADGWSPDGTHIDWWTEVDGIDGFATFRGGGALSYAPIAAVAMLVLSLGMIVMGRLRR